MPPRLAHLIEIPRPEANSAHFLVIGRHIRGKKSLLPDTYKGIYTKNRSYEGGDKVAPIDVYIKLSNERTIPAQLTNKASMKQLIKQIVRRKKLPAHDFDGRLLKYGLVRQGEDAPIADNLTLADVGVQSREVLTLISRPSHEHEVKENHITNIQWGMIFIGVEVLAAWLMNVMDGSTSLISPSMIIVLVLVFIALFVIALIVKAARSRIS
jgi:hypothetical protein